MAVTTSPISPIAGDTVALALSGATGTKFGFELKTKPSKSALRSGLRINAAKDDPAGEPPSSPLVAAERGLLASSFVPDVPGEYVVVGYDLLERAVVPSYHGDPAGDRGFELLASQTTTIYVGGKTTLPIRTQDGRGADLQLTVVNETITGAAMLAATDEPARVAALSSAVVAALAALVGQATSAIGPGTDAALTELRAKYEAHRVFVLVLGTEPHTVADNVNVARPTESFGRQGSIALFNALRRVVVDHMTTGSTVATSWHSAAGPVNHDDTKNLPLTGVATTIAEVTVGLADLRYRVYERHRAQVASPASHRNADATNTLSAASLLESLIVAYLDALAVENPSVVDGEPEGIIDLYHLYGFRNG